MSFYIRKSINIGPIRFNLSKSGIGVSAGVKGFRVGSGVRGNYVHMGVGGIYYRKTLSHGGHEALGDNPGKSQSPEIGDSASSNSHSAMARIESGDVTGMVHSSSVELIGELNAKRKILRIEPAVEFGSALLLLYLFLTSAKPAPLLLIAVGLVILAYFAYRRDVRLKTTVLLYDLDPTLEQAYGALHAAASQIASCTQCWHISASAKVYDRKYHAGASNLVERKNTNVRIASPSFLKTNIETVAINAGRQILYFFPDRILIYDRGQVGAVGYDELRLNVSTSRFIESSTPPSDAQVVDHTWQYVNKNGNPDRRFARNRQLPICLYDNIHFSSESGLNEVVETSQCGIGDSLAHAIRDLAQYTAVGDGNYRPNQSNNGASGTIATVSLLVVFLTACTGFWFYRSRASVKDTTTQSVSTIAPAVASNTPAPNLKTASDTQSSLIEKSGTTPSTTTAAPVTTPATPVPRYSRESLIKEEWALEPSGRMISTAGLGEQLRC